MALSSFCCNRRDDDDDDKMGNHHRSFQLVPSLKSLKRPCKSFSSGSGDSNSNSNSAGSSSLYHHACELLSLGSDIITTATVKEIKTPVGTTVEAGDVIAILSSSSSSSTGHDKSNHEFPAPLSGTISKLMMQVGQEVKVGEELCLIQTTTTTMEENKKQPSPMMSPEALAAKSLIEHVRDNAGLISDDFLQNEILGGNDDTGKKLSVSTLLHLSRLIRDQLPHLRAKALPLLEKVLELQQQQQQQPTADTTDEQQKYIGLAQTYTELATLHHQLNDVALAQMYLKKSLVLRQAHLGENHPETTASYIHLGMLLEQGGLLNEAVDSLKTALAIQIANMSANNNNTDKHSVVVAVAVAVANSHNNLGSLYYRMGRFELAVGHFQDALKIYQATQGEQDIHTAGTHNNVAMALRNLAKERSNDPEHKAQATEHCQMALQMRQELLGPRHADTASSHYLLAQLLSDAQQWEAALEQYKTACDIQQELYGHTAGVLAATRNNIGAVLFNQGDLEGALQEYEVALDILKINQADNPRAKQEMAATYNNIGIALMKKRDTDKAMAAHEEARKLLEQCNIDKDGAHILPQLVATLASLASANKLTLNLIKALELYKQAHQLLVEHYGENHPDSASFQNNIAMTLSAMSRYDDASDAYQSAAKAFAACQGPDHPHVGLCRFNLGLNLVHQYVSILKRNEASTTTNVTGKQAKKKQATNSLQQDSHHHPLLKQSTNAFQAAQTVWMKSFGIDHVQTKTAMKFSHDPMLALRIMPSSEAEDF